MKRVADVGTTAGVERVVLEVKGVQPVEFARYEAEIMRQLNERFGGVAWSEIVPAQMQAQLDVLVDEIIRANIQTLNMISSLEILSVAPDTLAPNIGATTMPEHDHSHHHHHDHAKAADDASGPGKSAADTPQTGGSSTSADSTNAASDQVGSQEAPPAPAPVDVQANDRPDVAVGQDASKPASGASIDEEPI